MLALLLAVSFLILDGGIQCGYQRYWLTGDASKVEAASPEREQNQDRLHRVRTPWCQRCGKPLVAHEQEYCGDCSRKQHEFHKGRAAFVYDETMRRSIAKFKYEGRQEYAAFYADEILKTCAREVIGWNAEAFVPIPLHSARRRKRGYNQAELLARELSGRSGIPVDKSLLIRTKNTRAQKELSDQERKANLKHAFSVREKRIPCKKIILVDDIYTTGSTMDEVAAVLKARGAEMIYFLCISVGRGS